MEMNRRKVLSTAGAAVVASQLGVGQVWAQGGPLKLGMSMPQTGPLGAGGGRRLDPRGNARCFPVYLRVCNPRGERLGVGRRSRAVGFQEPLLSDVPLSRGRAGAR